MTKLETNMTDEPMTLREKVLDVLSETGGYVMLHESRESLDLIATILEDTGAPAHMRVAKELRGDTE